MAVTFNFLRWPLLALFIMLLWHYKQYLKVPKNAAKPVWLISILLSVVLMLGFNKGQIEFDFLADMPLYLVWAWLQQLLLGPLLSRLMMRQLNVSEWVVACIVGMLFSIIHAPNHVLMLVTLFGGVGWSYAWLKYENLYANIFSHAILALIFYQVMPDAWLGSARIGVFF